jgi:hypothetical protein
MSSSEVLIHQPSPQEEQHYTPSLHHDAAGTIVGNEMDYRSIDYAYEPVAQSTMTGLVYHHHHDEPSSRILQAPVPVEALQAYANVVEAATACAVAVTAGDVLEAAMEGYDNNDNKRPLEDSTSDQDPNKRLRTSEVLLTAPKKVNNEQWDNMFERLKAYKAEHGDCLVPKRFVADPKLGTWVETQVRNR